MEQMRPLSLVELQGARDRVQDVGGGAGESAAF
jgi:hypothetical protein